MTNEMVAIHLMSIFKGGKRFVQSNNDTMTGFFSHVYHSCYTPIHQLTLVCLRRLIILAKCAVVFVAFEDVFIQSNFEPPHSLV